VFDSASVSTQICCVRSLGSSNQSVHRTTNPDPCPNPDPCLTKCQSWDGLPL